MSEILNYDLELIRRRCAERDIRLIVLGYPVRGFPNETLERFSVEHNLEFIPLYDIIEKQPEIEERRQALYLTDGHCSAAGNKLIAEIIARRIQGVNKIESEIRTNRRTKYK